MIDKLLNEQFETNDFTFHQQKKDIVRIEYATNCIPCNSACHYPCGIPESNDRKYCLAMKDGKCTI
ncbi:unnamed protein product [Paramecium primaurelia]|uniref:Uncharacterized protein n=1 Tax=Paramecium primaurelia TaxID=5886 RepID=A0A8S1QMU3_PARPR|nr:unnamed protein product [Paramecium primaurelia]